MYELATTPKPDPVWNATYVSDMGIPVTSPLQTSMSSTEYGSTGLGCCGKCAGILGLGQDEESPSWLPGGHGIMDLVVYGIAGYALLSAFGTFREKQAKTGKRLKSAKASYEKAKSEAGIFGGLFS